MSDLNQMTTRVKSGLDLQCYLEQMLICIDNYESSGEGPVCCFYVCKRNGVSDEMISVNFKDRADSSEELVVGCSKGCLPAAQVKQNIKLYRKMLCEECVKDARKVVKNGS